MTTFGNKAAELIAEAAVADDAALPAYNVRRCFGAGRCAARLRRGVQTLRAGRTKTRRCAAESAPETADARRRRDAQEHLMRVVKEETQEHYRALLATMTAIQAREGGAEAAAPEDAAAVMVHNRALLRNKRLMLAYMCVARPLCRNGCVATLVRTVPRCARRGVR